jgi:hypothetical protein
MIEFTVDPIDSSAADRFTALVNRLLPSGWRFGLNPTPSTRLVIDPNPLIAPLLVTIAGQGTLNNWDQFRTLEQQSQAWQRWFRESLTKLIEKGACRFQLAVNRDDQFFYDSFFLETIDVVDLERSPPRAAAASLCHALEESQRDTTAIRTRAGFDEAHRFALSGHERAVMGGRTRLENEVVTLPQGMSVHTARATDTFEQWEPYVRLQNNQPVGDVLAVYCQIRGRTILRSRMGWFGSLSAYRHAMQTAGFGTAGAANGGA